MNTHTNETKGKTTDLLPGETGNPLALPKGLQILNGPDGKPLYVLVPYAQYMESVESSEHPDDKVEIPNEVVRLAIVESKGIVRAWREHLGFTQAALAKEMKISQPALAQLEKPGRVLRLPTRKRLAEALGIASEQLRLVEED